MSGTGLTTYLNDHLAGSVAALDLLDDLIADPVEPDDVQFFTELRGKIEADQEVLRDLIQALGSSESPVRKAAGWMAEKVSSLKLRWDDPGNHGLRHFESLEALAFGIQGKLSLWRALEVVAPTVPELEKLDLERYQRRAETQYAGVERRRLNAAQAAFAASHR